MKKHILLISLLIFVFAASYAQGEDTSDTSGSFYLKAGIGAGAQFGVVTENFYRLFSTRGLYRVSWLTWETMPAFFGTFNATAGYEFSNNRSINVEAYFSSVYPTVTGAMEDFDALLFDDRITDFSHHDNYTDLLIDTGFYADYSFSNGFGAGIGFEYQNVKFRAQNGYSQHNTTEYGTGGYWSADMPHTSEYTGNTVITYDFFSFYWKVGLVWRHEFSSRFNLGLDAWVNLYRYNRILDKHYAFSPNIPYDYYTDIVETWFSGTDIRATIEYAFTNHFLLSLRVAGTYLPAEYGDDYIGVPPNYTLNIGYKGGFDAWNASASASVIFRL
ncbi:MAG: hypothetical protein J5631_00055 [Spirochaetaceae bacterium]|nr:hypothetical protein [Spirochaetaceae bacterium]